MKKKLFIILPVVFVLLCSVFLFTACVDADYGVQITKMNGLGYLEQQDAGTSNCTAEYVFTRNTVSGREVVYVLYFANEHHAVEHENHFLDKSLSMLKENNPDIAETYTYVRVGKIFLHGTEKGVADALS